LAAVVVLTAAPAWAAAQVNGLPVVASGVTRGQQIGVDLGVANDAAGGATTVGAHLATGLGPLALTAMVSRGATVDGGEAVWSPGASAAVAIFGGPLVPFRVTLGAGVGVWEQGVVNYLHLPVTLGFAATIPNPAFAIRPWLAPRISIHRASFLSTSASDTRFGVSGGIDLAFLNGMVVRASYDREFADGVAPGVLGVGLSYAIGRR
jgi:hypothetical protein